MIGYAKAETPLLERAAGRPGLPALRPRHKLPDLVADLSGQIDIDLDGRIDTVQRRPPHHLRNRPRRPGLQIHPQPQRRPQGPAPEQRRTSAPHAGRGAKVTVARPERDGDEARTRRSRPSCGGGAQRKRHRPGHRRRTRCRRGRAPRLALCIAVCLGPASVLGARLRLVAITYLRLEDRRLQRTSSVAIRCCTANVWITDSGMTTRNYPSGNGLYEYRPLSRRRPCSRKPNTQEAFGFAIRDTEAPSTSRPAKSSSRRPTAARSAIFEEGKSTPSGPASTESPPVRGADIHIAIDNTQTISGGRVYLSLTAPENDVEVLDAAAPGPAPGDRELHRRQQDHGHAQRAVRQSREGRGRQRTANLYVIDTARKRWSTSSTRPAPSSAPSPSRGAAEDTTRERGVAVDPTNGNVAVDSADQRRSRNTTPRGTSRTYTKTAGHHMRPSGTRRSTRTATLRASASTANTVDIFIADPPAVPKVDVQTGLRPDHHLGHAQRHRRSERRRRRRRMQVRIRDRRRRIQPRHAPSESSRRLQLHRIPPMSAPKSRG